jgi:hypothetical protein
MQFIASFFCKMNLIITSLAFLIFVSCSSSDPRIAEFVDSELDLYPEARLTDIYKSFFQDAYGPDHLIPDTTRAGIFLSRELAHEEWPDTLKFQPTGTQHDYIRINLLLVKNGTIPRDSLLLAMVKSAPLARNPDIEDFKKEWEKVVVYIEKKYPGLPGLAADKQTIEETLAVGDVVIHHSDHYNQTYKRRYRIIHRSVFDSWNESIF